MSTHCRKRKYHQTTLFDSLRHSSGPDDTGSQRDQMADGVSPSTCSPTLDLTPSCGEEEEEEAIVIDCPTGEGPLPGAIAVRSCGVTDGPRAGQLETAPAGEDVGRHTDVAPPPSEPSWRGVPLARIDFGPSAYPLLPLPLQSSPTHAVLFKPGDPARSPFPDHFKDVWDEHHVKMPCSKMSQYPVNGEGAGKQIVPRWELIHSALTTRPISDSHQLADAILVYNSRYAARWRFDNLHDYFANHCGEEEADEFFSSLLPRIIDLALRLPHLVTHALPLLRKQDPYQVTMTQLQAACLLANAFLCTFPSRNATQRGAEYSTYPFINFNGLFASRRRGEVVPGQTGKLACLFHYFQRVTSRVPEGTLSFERRVLASPPRWEGSARPLSKMHLDSRGTIEGCGHGMLQVDFANKYLGGGVLQFGCVQEEIRFLICPELMVSMLLTEELDENECLLMTGAEQYSTYRGYASTFEWSGHHDDLTIRDGWGRREVQVVAMDAMVVTNKKTQYAPTRMRRELNKAFCGFWSSDSTPCGRNMAVATGNWGCGAFGGDPSLKAVLQLMAASEAGRDIVYFTFGNTELRNQMDHCYRLLSERMVTVGDLWKLLALYHTEVIEKKGHTLLLPFIISQLEHTPSEAK